MIPLHHAYREAGHAVMCIARGITFDYVSLASVDSDGSLCRQNAAAHYFYQHRTIPSRAVKAMAVHATLIALAGPAALANLPTTPSDKLLSTAIQVAENIAWFYSRNPNQFLYAQSREARKVVKAHWLQVEQVARLLNDHQRLDYRALHDLYC